MSSFPYLHSGDLKEFSRGLGGPCDMCVSLKLLVCFPLILVLILKRKTSAALLQVYFFLKVFAEPEETKHLPSQLKILF